RGWLEDAYAAGPNIVEETMKGVVAFVVPGRDRYSIAQGTKSAKAGGIEAGATSAVIQTLDRYLPSNPSLSATAATILNQVAQAVRPASAKGKFPSAFANLSFAEKAKVFQTVEGFTGSDAGSIRFLFGNLPDRVACRAQRARMASLRQRGEQSGHRDLQIRPRRSVEAALGSRSAAELLRLANGRCRRIDTSLLRQLAARDAGRLRRLRRRRRTA